MSTHSHSDHFTTEQTTAGSGGPSAAEQPERPYRGGSVLARIPDVRPHLEDDPPTPDKRRIRVDTGKPQTGATNAVLRRHHSSWHISRRLMIVVGSVVAVVAIAAVFRMRNDSAQPADQADAIGPTNSNGPAIEWQADRRTKEPSYPFGQMSEMHDRRSHDRGDAPEIPTGSSRPAPDYFSDRPSSPLSRRWTDRNVAGEADPRVFARLGSNDRPSATHHDQLAPPQKESIFPWRRSGQRLSWQQHGLQQPGLKQPGLKQPSLKRPSLRRPEGRPAAGTNPERSRYGERFSGGKDFNRRNINSPEPPQYPDTGVGGEYFPPQGRDRSRFSPPGDYRSARGGTTLGEDARRSTYDDSRRGGASFDGRIEPSNYRVLR